MVTLKQLDEKIQRWLWRVGYASEMVFKTRCTFATGMERADQYIMLCPTWWKEKPVDAARSKLWIYER